MNQEQIREKVRKGSSKIARDGDSRRRPKKSCCGAIGDTPGQFARKIGFSAEELAALPEGANLGLSCGNPTALASLKPGETALDLGAGGGFDAFLAGHKVGKSGRVIGVDMTPDMLAKARRNAAAYRKQSGLDNVEFRLGEIERLPVADASVDVVISNCVVINLSPDKPQVWREIACVLKPGGRVAVSDLALLQPLPSSVSEMVEALVGCVAGAVLVEETARMARAAGLTDLALNRKADFLDAKADWNDPLYRKSPHAFHPARGWRIFSSAWKCRRANLRLEGCSSYPPRDSRSSSVLPFRELRPPMVRGAPHRGADPRPRRLQRGAGFRAPAPLPRARNSNPRIRSIFRGQPLSSSVEDRAGGA
ncbi:MAG: arsenite methyltransferase [Verrucomicrobiae bacterium]|nr:arsenite methyltransferase [Verrucomicrobiae bacterium]